MYEIPAARHPMVFMAIRVGRMLADADLVHPVSDDAGEFDVLEWATEFASLHGTWLEPHCGNRSKFDPLLEGFVYVKAANQGWVLRETRELRGESPADIYFKMQLASVQAIQRIPAHIPRSCAHQALVDVVTRELRERALHYLRVGGLHEKGVLTFESDGRFEKLSMHGVGIATCAAGERDKREWIAALESNLGIQVDSKADHQVLVEIDGKSVACGPQNVRVQVFNDRVDFGEDSSAALVFNFTAEGVIQDVVAASGESLGTDAKMYDEILNDMVEVGDRLNVDRDHS